MTIVKTCIVAAGFALTGVAAQAATWTSVGGCDTVVLNPDDTECFGFVSGNVQQSSFDPNGDLFVDGASSVTGIFDYQDWEEIQRDDEFGDVQSGSFTIAENTYSMVTVFLKTGNQWSAHLFDGGLSGLLQFTTASGTGGLSNYLVVGRMPEVPLPATGFLLIGGLAGLGLLRRFRSA